MGPQFLGEIALMQCVVRVRSLVVIAACMLAAACTTESVVYRSATDFAAPPTEAANFIGYYDAANKRTVCGSCHVEYAARWAQTKSSGGRLPTHALPAQAAFSL